MKGGLVDNTTEWEDTGWAEWPEPELEIDDEAFAQAIAEGRELPKAA